MKELYVKILVVGGGPAGMSAAVAAYDAGITDVLIVEREDTLGGILCQCIHNGFGLHRFGEELTGPEYAARYVAMVRERNIPFRTETTVLSISPDRTVLTTSPHDGMVKIHADAVILAMGCRERPRGALNIAGTRPAGVYTAGAAQKFVNRKGYLPGSDVVILGSGDIGLIMARRMTLEGARVHAVCELLPYSGGLQRNIEQCLNDFGIPLLLSHTVTAVHGKERVTGVTVSRVDESRRPIPGTEREIPCDTLLLSCGLLPENELTREAGIALHSVTGGAKVDQHRETEIPGIYACGNVLHVHDLVDYVSEEAAIAGEKAAKTLLGESFPRVDVAVATDGRVRYAVPQRITADTDVTLYFRVRDVYRNVKITLTDGEKLILSRQKLKVAPGEMETVTVPASAIRSADGKTLMLGLEVETNENA